MKKIKKYFVVVLVMMLVASLGWTAEISEKKDNDNRNPNGCLDVGYKFELQTLHLLPPEQGAQQSLYLVFNQLDVPLNLYQMRDSDGNRNLYLNHTINLHQWGVFSTGEKELKFICTVNDPKLRFGRVVNCADSVRICEYTNVIYGMNNRGNYWLVNSYTRNAAVREVVHYGIIPARNSEY